MRVVGHRKTKTTISHKVSVLNSKMSMEIDEVMKENSKIKLLVSNLGCSLCVIEENHHQNFFIQKLTQIFGNYRKN